MPAYNKITFQDIESFIAYCSEKTGDDYEPYVDYDTEPDITKSTPQPAILDRTGIELLENNNSSALYLYSANKLIGYCSTFAYYNDDGTTANELSVLIAPEYRYHGLGRMLVLRMLSAIEENLPSRILLVGSNEHFAEVLGFTYSHSEHFMTRKPFAELDADAALCPPHIDINTCKSNPEQYPVAVSRSSHKDEGHHTYLLLCNGARASRCSIFECSDYVNIANVYTNKKYRGRRLAGQLINAVASDFPQKKLLLQVAGSNTAAIHAYTNAGFSFLKTFDYYVATL